jgi:hypothetical protein
MPVEALKLSAEEGLAMLSSSKIISNVRERFLVYMLSFERRRQKDSGHFNISDTPQGFVYYNVR